MERLHFERDPDIVAFANTKSVREDAWLKDIGVEIENGITQYSCFIPRYVLTTNSPAETPTEDSENTTETTEKPAGKEARRLNGFKVLDQLGQDVDFRYKEGDDRIGKYLKGIVLQKVVKSVGNTNTS
jgi:hypothetical protein